MTNITTEEQFGGIEYAGSESPRIDLHAIYDDYENSIVVLGVGNILLTDEGLGVHVVEDLKANYTFTPQISLIDGGTMGMELLTYMRGMQDILRIRAIQENPLEDAIVIGVEPESLDVGFEPSAPVQKALPEVKERVLRVLREWGIQIEPK